MWNWKRQIALLCCEGAVNAEGRDGLKLRVRPSLEYTLPSQNHAHSPMHSMNAQRGGQGEGDHEGRCQPQLRSSKAIETIVSCTILCASSYIQVPSQKWVNPNKVTWLQRCTVASAVSKNAQPDARLVWKRSPEPQEAVIHLVSLDIL